MGLGPVFVAAIILGYLGGSWLDRRFDWAPWGLVGGLALGMAAGIREVVRVIGRLNDAEAARRERRRAGRSEGGPRPPPGAG